MSVWFGSKLVVWFGGDCGYKTRFWWEAQLRLLERSDSWVKMSYEFDAN
jgi:hypothetical protein